MSEQTVKEYQEIIPVVYIGISNDVLKPGELIDVVIWVDDGYICVHLPNRWSESYNKLSDLFRDFRFPENVPFGSIRSWRTLELGLGDQT